MGKDGSQDPPGKGTSIGKVGRQAGWLGLKFLCESQESPQGNLGVPRGTSISSPQDYGLQTLLLEKAVGLGQVWEKGWDLPQGYFLKWSAHCSGWGGEGGVPG